MLQITIVNKRHLINTASMPDSSTSLFLFTHSVIKLLVITLPCFNGVLWCCNKHSPVKYSHCQSDFDNYILMYIRTIKYDS